MCGNAPGVLQVLVVDAHVRASVGVDLLGVLQQQVVPMRKRCLVQTGGALLAATGGNWYTELHAQAGTGNLAQPTFRALPTVHLGGGEAGVGALEGVPVIQGQLLHLVVALVVNQGLDRQHALHKANPRVPATASSNFTLFHLDYACFRSRETSTSDTKLTAGRYCRYCHRKW